ncbi:MAG TPA: hypothetical protein VGM76_19210 [Lacipirellulaceae bacterium]|jgi:hypothetical protein
MSRRLFNMAPTICLVACVALMGMWVRSYSARDTFIGSTANGRLYQVVSMSGRLEIFLAVNVVSKDLALVQPWSMQSVPIDFHFPTTTAPRTGLLARLGFTLYAWHPGSISTAPFWVLVLASGSLAILLRLRSPLRFNLRGLFVVTTFLAIVLGMSAWLDRSWIGKEDKPAPQPLRYSSQPLATWGHGHPNKCYFFSVIPMIDSCLSYSICIV